MSEIAEFEADTNAIPQKLMQLTQLLEKLLEKTESDSEERLWTPADVANFLNDEVDRDSPYVNSCGSVDSRGIHGRRSLSDRQGEGIAFSFCVWGESLASL